MKYLLSFAVFLFISTNVNCFSIAKITNENVIGSNGNSICYGLELNPWPSSEPVPTVCVLKGSRYVTP